MTHADLYSATGNILWVMKIVDLKESGLSAYAELAQSLCANQQADGVMLINPKTYEAWMLNPDGSNGGFCGNGLRAVAFHLAQQGQNLDVDESIIHLEMSGVKLKAVCRHDHVELMLHPKLSAIQTFELEGVRGYRLNVPNPHCVVVDPPITWLFPQAAESLCERLDHNVEFVYQDANIPKVLVYERGAGPTGACGSGALATFKVLQHLGLVANAVTLAFPGGHLTVQEQGAKLLILGSVEWIKTTCI